MHYYRSEYEGGDIGYTDMICSTQHTYSKNIEMPDLTLWRPLLPHGYRVERQSALMSKITN